MPCCERIGPKGTTRPWSGPVAVTRWKTRLQGPAARPASCAERCCVSIRSRVRRACGHARSTRDDARARPPHGVVGARAPSRSWDTHPREVSLRTPGRTCTRSCRSSPWSSRGAGRGHNARTRGGDRASVDLTCYHPAIMCRNIKTLFNFDPPATGRGGPRRVPAVRAQAEWIHRAVEGERGGVRTGDRRCGGGRPGAHRFAGDEFDAT